jgi:hypothetical protein
MKSIKLIALGVMLTLGIFCAAFYSSCSKDTCGAVTCLNRGVCGGGICTCPTGGGIGGANCDIVYRDIYAHKYQGNPPGNSPHTDSNNTLVFVADVNDTVNYNTMHLTWNDTNTKVVELPITLANNTAVGSTFSVTPTTITSPSGQLLVYTGNGSVNGTTASLLLNEQDTSGAVKILHFDNFYRQ